MSKAIGITFVLLSLYVTGIVYGANNYTYTQGFETGLMSGALMFVGLHQLA